mmetsp:Transcript_117/g.407  ORF Transcript_117/g.407 Transcript_117/m.407 type:complete len:235 (+) Transcript_117:468-1172(+)
MIPTLRESRKCLGSCSGRLGQFLRCEAMHGDAAALCFLSLNDAVVLGDGHALNMLRSAMVNRSRSLPAVSLRHGTVVLGSTLLRTILIPTLTSWWRTWGLARNFGGNSVAAIRGYEAGKEGGDARLETLNEVNEIGRCGKAEPFEHKGNVLLACACGAFLFRCQRRCCSLRAVNLCKKDLATDSSHIKPCKSAACVLDGDLAVCHNITSVRKADHLSVTMLKEIMLFLPDSLAG